MPDPGPKYISKVTQEVCPFDCPKSSTCSDCPEASMLPLFVLRVGFALSVALILARHHRKRLAESDIDFNEGT